MPPNSPFFHTQRLPDLPDALAPDGSAVRLLLRLNGGSMAHFELAAGQTSIAVAHRTVEELWFFLGGRGEMWRKLGDQESVVTVEAGVSISIPCGAHFQFRAFAEHPPLAAIAVTMPPWPGEDEVVRVPDFWDPTVGG